jgi:hypothetical protein
MATARQVLGGCGTQTAGLGFGGYINGSGNTNTTEEYDGSSWTAGGALGTSKKTFRRCRFTNSWTLAIGGFIGTNANSNATEEYDGSSWTAGGSLNTSKT